MGGTSLQQQKKRNDVPLTTYHVQCGTGSKA